MVKSLFIIAHKREKLFFKTLKKLKKCKNYEEFKKLIIFQEISKNTLQKIKKVDEPISVKSHRLFTTVYTRDTRSIKKGNI